MKKTLKVKNLSKTFDKNRQVLQDINLSVHEGECLAVSGQNGVGKTTLMRILATLTFPTKGEIYLANHPYKRLIKKGGTLIGWMPSGNLGMYMKLTGLENIRYFAAFYQVNRKKIENMISDWREISTFKNALETPFYLCSSGMKSSLLLFKSIIHDPLLVLLDEPLVNFDTESRNMICNKFKKYTKNKITLFTSHYNDDVNVLASKQVYIHGGEIV